ncbi:MAG: hypothetical protein K8U03_02505 [Planctomycetia bacterium]|nr:hypothetical protein [Planctomycetia bacterium]
MSEHNRALEDERRLIEEQAGDLAEEAAANKERQRRSELIEMAIAQSPPQFHGHLRSFLDRAVKHEDPEFRLALQEFFLREVPYRGLVRALLYNIRNDDEDTVRRGHRWIILFPPPCPLAFDVIRQALDTDDDWRDKALKLVCDYAPSKESAAELLAEHMQRGSDLAALELSAVDPDAPRLVEAMTAALGRNWVGSFITYWEAGLSGVGLTACALARLGPKARGALPALRAAALEQRGPDQTAAFEAYSMLCEDEADIRRLAEQMSELETNVERQDY